MKEKRSLTIFFFLLVFLFSDCSIFFPDEDPEEGKTTKYWKQATSPVNEELRGVFFVNEKTGWIVGLNSTILKTTDGGKNWDKQAFNGFANFTRLFFIDENTGWVVGSFGTVVKTTNGGATWNLLTNGNMQNGFSEGFKDVYFSDSQKGWIIGDCGTGTGGIVLKTENGGESWQISIAQLPTHLFSICALSPQQVFVGGGFQSPGMLYYTNDAGKSWSEISTGQEEFTIDDIAWAVSTLYLVCAWSENGLLSTDLGLTWIKSKDFGYTSKIMIDDEVVWLTGGTQKLSVDGGTTFTTTTEANSQWVNSGNGFTDAFAIGQKAWGISAQGGIFYFD